MNKTIAEMTKEELLHEYVQLNEENKRLAAQSNLLKQSCERLNAANAGLENNNKWLKERLRLVERIVHLDLEQEDTRVQIAKLEADIEKLKQEHK